MNEDVLLDFGKWTPLVAVGVAAALTGIAALCAAGTSYVLALRKDTLLRRALTLVTEQALSAVAHINVTLRPKLEAAMADGKLTATELQALKDAAMALVKASAGQGAIKLLEEMLGSDAALTAFLSGLIERALGIQKQTHTLPIAPTLPTTGLPPASAVMARADAESTVALGRTGEYPANPPTALGQK